MRNCIVILTFPAHFYLTKLCLDSILKHFQCCKNILILVDDTSELAWDSYYTDCKNLYLSEFVETQAISKINELNFLNLHNYHPWVKQQIIKFHLDLFLSPNEIFFTDGDVIFQTDIPYDCTPYTINDKFDYKNNDNYVSSLLNIETKGILISENKRVDTAAVPCRDIKLEILTQLRNYVEKTTQRAFLDLHTELNKTTARYSISEWELLETFKKEILKLPLNLTNINISNAMNNQQSHLFGYSISTIWESEKMLDIEFWAKNNLQTDNELWNKLPDFKYIHS